MLTFVDPVSSTIVHSSGTVVATCSGQRAVPDFGNTESDSESNESGEDETDESEDETNGPEDSIGDSSSTYSMKATGQTPDNSIKVWSL